MPRSILQEMIQNKFGGDYTNGWVKPLNLFTNQLLLKTKASQMWLNRSATDQVPQLSQAQS